MTTDVQKHIFSLGARHEICQRCGEQYAGTSDGCTGVLDHGAIQTLIKAAHARGREQGIDEAQRFIGQQRETAKAAGDNALADALWRANRAIGDTRRSPSAPTTDLEVLTAMLERAGLKRRNGEGPYDHPPEGHFNCWRETEPDEKPWAHIMLVDDCVGTANFEFDENGTITKVSVSGD